MVRGRRQPTCRWEVAGSTNLVSNSSETKRTIPLSKDTVASGQQGKIRPAEADEMHVSEARDGGVPPKYTAFTISSSGGDK